MNIPNASALLRSSGGIEELNLTDIRADEQVRGASNIGFSDESLNSLADSIKSIGVQEPIIVRPEPEKDRYPEKYRIICGERRFRAAKLAGIKTIPAIIRTDLTDPKQILFLQITENAQRENIDSMELAQSCQKLLDLGMIKSQIATAIGKTNDVVSYLFSMLDMPPFLLNEYKAGHLSHSPRTCYEACKLYERDPEGLEQCITQIMASKNEESELENIIDRPTIKKIKSYLDGRKTDEEVSFNESESESQAAESGVQDESYHDDDNSVTDENVSNDESGSEGDSSYSSEEYPEHEEREHSAEVSMAPAYQGDDSHTAGLGKPDFTDRDTRADHDLSDNTEYASEREDDVQTGEPEYSKPDVSETTLSAEGEHGQYKSLYVLYLFKIYLLTLERGEHENEIILLGENNEKVAAPIDALQLVNAE